MKTTSVCIPSLLVAAFLWGCSGQNIEETGQPQDGDVESGEFNVQAQTVVAGKVADEFSVSPP